MSAWRRKGLELFYDIKFSFVGGDDTVYSLIFELRDRVVTSHLKNDNEELNKIYNYAEWCFNQYRRSHYLHNAICVGFYEHLVENDITRGAIPYRVKPYIFESVKTLFEWMLRKKVGVYKELVEDYNRINKTNFEI
ncbi:hypothetical protein GK047_29020 [Paenibacillus sp. SYP-B3998]|uniref:DUF7674 domain-containing protein n=1 Tax=Paenibacillus sp. SYP-B3998 TaxID=2678564 RepID=A0A6G4A6K2_9BACL|nr:hypothetical protein [Paenibacillus sp. SYP-B3998]NEW09928.1 hypothetical protein [Paenibacillus sp. SYP-B3998]